MPASPLPTAAAGRFGGRWRFFLVVFAATLVPMLLWSIASPLMSVPDEPSHAVRAASVVRGEIAAIPWEQDQSLIVAHVPEYVANTHNLRCFAFEPDVTAACQNAHRSDGTRIVATGTSANLNSPAYYAVVGWPTLLLDGDAALYAMRLVNALLCAATLAVMFMCLRALPRNRWATVGAVVGVTPMVLYLGGSINPNGIEVAASGALLAALLVAVRTTVAGRRLWELTILAMIAAALVMSTRSIALLWVALIVVAALVLASPGRLVRLLRTPAGWTLLAGSAVVGLASVWWYLHPPIFPAVVSEPVGPAALALVFVFTLTRTAEFFFGMIGYFGWVDTPAPNVTVAVWSTAILALLATALIWSRARARFAVWGAIAVCVLVPAVTQVAVYQAAGYMWQGRYTLAVLLCALLLAGIALDDDESFPSPARAKRLVAVGYGALAVGSVWAFVWTLRRYVIGEGAPLETMLSHPQWQPPIPWVPLTALYAVAIAGATMFAARSFRPDASAEHAMHGDTASASSPTHAGAALPDTELSGSPIRISGAPVTAVVSPDDELI
ncbi:DUF2142 domain-containing protein [Plantibacter sp. YIM 135347]|uniref:DUF2142 domain-containing protein n=1 Tax=Plantibacter sp. YIM 135347 TaxID=3423919 RepID=UPI003D34894E